MTILRTYHHSDHTSTRLSTGLGSSSWITNNNGEAIQHLHYLPYGEDWINQRTSATSWNAPYTFSAKEKDVETGYGYFGARYYDSGLSIWLSVDPMADKYPSLTPYAYCANNPVKLIDPNGMEIDEAATKKDPPLKTWLVDSQKNTSDLKTPYVDPQSNQQGNTSSQSGNTSNNSNTSSSSSNSNSQKNTNIDLNNTLGFVTNSTGLLNDVSLKISVPKETPFISTTSKSVKFAQKLAYPLLVISVANDIDLSYQGKQSWDLTYCNTFITFSSLAIGGTYGIALQGSYSLMKEYYSTINKNPEWFGFDVPSYPR